MSEQVFTGGFRPDVAGSPAPAALRGPRAALRSQLASLPLAEQLDRVRPAPAEGVQHVQMSTGGGPPAAPPIDMANVEASVRTYCAGDPIAMQKLDDVDNEAYMEDVPAPTARTAFYRTVGEYINANHASLAPGAIYNACFNRASTPYKFKGKKIDPATMTGLCARTSSVNGFWRFQVKQSIFLGQAATELGLPETEDAVKKLAYAKWIAACQTGGDLMPYLDTSKAIAPKGFPAWFTPDQVRVDADPNVAFTDLMSVFALQPEWFGEGNVFFEIDPALITGEIRKPTAYDGMQSSLWVARNQPAETFGVTGGGAREFLAQEVPATSVKSLRGVVPSADFLAQVARLQSRAVDMFLQQNPQVKAELDQLDTQIAALPDGPAKEDLKKKRGEVTSWTPNLTDWVLRGQTTQLTSHIGVKIRDAKAALEEVRRQTEAERSAPSAHRDTATLVNP